MNEAVYAAFFYKMCFFYRQFYSISFFKVSCRTNERQFVSFTEIGLDFLSVSEGSEAKTLLKILLK